MAGRPLVLHVLEAVRGGTSRHVVDLVRSAPGLGHHVVVPAGCRSAPHSGAPVDLDGVEHIREAGGTIHVVDMRRSPVHPANAAAVLRIRRLVHTHRAAVVHGHSAIGGALARLAAAGSGVPAVYTPNGLAQGRAALGIERLLGPLTAAFVAVSESESKLAGRAGLVSPGRLHVIPNGIDLEPPGGDPPDLRTLLRLPPGTPLVGTVARLVAQKSPTDFVEICATIARRRGDTHFLLIGMGPLRGAVDAAVGRAGIRDRFHRIDHLPGAAGVLGQLTVFTLPSRFEGGPYTPLEAMRAGTPVVLTDVVGNRDAVIDGVTGALRPYGDVAGMAAAIEAFLDDEARRRTVVVAATDRLRAEFDAALMGQRLAALYEELIRAARRRSTRRLPQAAPSSSSHAPEDSAAV